MNRGEPKQVIVLRNDLRNAQGQKVRTGKLVAQGSHASMKALLNIGSITEDYSDIDGRLVSTGLYIPLYEKNHRFNKQPEIDHAAALEWLTGRFTKVVLQIDSEEEIKEVYNKAKEAGLLCSIITDAGLTEFGGVPTVTAAAIGPAYPDQFVGITDHLKLL